MLGWTTILNFIIAFITITLAFCIYFLIVADDKSIWITVTVFAGIVLVIAGASRWFYHKTDLDNTEKYSNVRGYEDNDGEGDSDYDKTFPD